MWHIEHFKEVVNVASDVFDHFVLHSDQVCSSGGADSPFSNVEAKVCLEGVKSEDTEDDLHNLSALSMLDSLEEVDIGLKCLSFTISHGKLLDEVGCVIHHGFKASFACLLELNSLLLEFLEESNFTELKKVEHGVNPGHVVEGSDLLLDVEGRLWELPCLLDKSAHHVLDNLDHENSIIAFGS